MGLDSSLLDPPESSSTKRLPALPNVDRETKRLCTQPSQWPSENADLEVNKAYNSYGSSNLSYLSYDNATMQNAIFLYADRSDSLLPHDFGGLDFLRAPLGTESELGFSNNSIHAQNIESYIESNQQVDRYDHQSKNSWSVNAFDLDQACHVNNITMPHLTLSYEPDIDYNINLDQNWKFPELDGAPSELPSIDAASTWINVPTKPEKAGVYQPLDTFALPEFKITGVTVEGEELLFTGIKEEDLIGKKDISSHTHLVQPAPSESISKNPVIDPNQINICFGVIIAPVASSFAGNQETSIIPVTISPFADVMKISFQDSKKYAGILDMPVLCTLPEEFTIEYTANLMALKSQTNRQRRKKETAINSNSSHDCLVRIVVYGAKSEGKAVGKSLSDAGLYLQHPSAMELYKHVDYWNPHYLLRPGSQMPRLEILSISGDTPSTLITESLDVKEKSRFMQIFNSANGAISPFTVTPSPRLKSSLKEHQLAALAMMIEKECGIIEGAKFPNLWIPSENSGSTIKYCHKITGAYHRSPTPVYGGILADEMGLGKSLSVLALVCSSLDSLHNQNELPENQISRATLIVTPKSTIPGWQQQVERHIHAGQLRVVVYHGPGRDRLPPNFWQADIVLTTYETIRLESTETGPLYSRTWSRVVLDEAHHIRNRSSQSFKAVSAINSKARWCLTGTPIHNSLDDYGALLSFLGVPQLMEKSQFDYWISSPISKKQPNGESTLGDLIRATCLRRTKDMMQGSLKLPLRIEKTEEIKLHQADQRLYDFFRERTAKIAAGLAGPDEGTSKFSGKSDTKILTLINILRRICNHGEDLLPQSALEAWRSNSTLVDWNTTQSCSKLCESCESYEVEVDFASNDNPHFRDHISRCAACSIQNQLTTTKEVLGDSKSEVMGCDFGEISPSFRFSAKIDALLRNIDTEQTLERYTDKAAPVKSVIFSQWTTMLDLIGKALAQHGLQFQRIDGQSSLKQRNVAIQQFKEDPVCTIMIASIGSAGEGVDLTAANHVHLVEPHWNPMVEAQAVDRVHRIGQTREVIVTRYIVKDTIETYIQCIQREKVRLISRSLGSAELLQEDIEDMRWKVKSITSHLSLEGADLQTDVTKVLGCI